MTPEQALQTSCVRWFRLQYPNGLLFCNNNNTDARNPIKGYFNKCMGVLAGVSDLTYVNNGLVIFIELKHGKNKQSESQIEFQKKVEAYGFKYYLVYSLESFIKIINQFNQSTQ